MNKQVNSMQEVMGARVQMSRSEGGQGCWDGVGGAAGMSLYFLRQSTVVSATLSRAQNFRAVREEAKGCEGWILAPLLLRAGRCLLLASLMEASWYHSVLGTLAALSSHREVETVIRWGS